MNNQIKFSIGIPVHNSSKYLKRCLTSILLQSYRNFEVICIDDFSTDDSLSILNEFSKKDKRFKVFAHTENKGILLTRKEIVVHSNSDYFIWCDSDDQIDTNLLIEMVKIIDASNTKNICIMHNAFVIDNYNNKKLLIKKKIKKSISVKDAMILCSTNNKIRSFPWLYVIPSSIIKKSFLNLPTDNPRNYVDDVLISCRYFMGIDKFIIDNRPFYYYYYVNSSDSTDSNIIKRLYNTTIAINEFFKINNIKIYNTLFLLGNMQKAIYLCISDGFRNFKNVIKISKSERLLAKDRKSFNYISRKDKILIKTLIYSPFLFTIYYSRKKTRYTN